MFAHMERIDENGVPSEFSLVVVRQANNPRAGSIVTLNRVRKLGHAAGHNHKERGTLPLYNVRKNQPCTPVVDNILFYNGMKVLW